MRNRIAELEEREQGGGVSLVCVSLSVCAAATQAELQKGRQLDFHGEAITSNGNVKIICLTDTGSSALGFVDDDFARRNKLPRLALTQPYKLRLADDEFGPNITYMVLLKYAFGSYLEELWCLVTKLGRFDVIFGMLWLEQHNPSLALGDRTMTFHSDHCMTNCLLNHKPVTIHSITPPQIQVTPA